MKSDEPTRRLENVADVRRIETIYGEYGAQVYGFCYRLCGNAADAEDLTAEVFLAVCKGISRFQSRSKTRTWLLQIALYKYRDLISRRRTGSISLDDVEPIHPPGLDPLDRITIEQAIDRLSAEERESVILVKVEGLKYREAAKVLGVPLGTLQSRVFLAMSKLRTLCTAGDETPESHAPETPCERCVHEM